MQSVLIAGNGSQTLAHEISKQTKIKLLKTETLQFSDSETLIRIKESVQGKTVYVLEQMNAPVNDKVMELLLLCNAAKENRAKKVIALVPYLGYSRQDRVTKTGEPISIKVLAKALLSAGCTKMITVDIHSQRGKKYFGKKLTNLEFFNVSIHELKKRNWKNEIVIAPDEGARKLAKKYGKTLKTQIAWMEKYRPKPEAVAELKLHGIVNGKNALIVDDMINTASTMKPVVELLRKNGVKKISVLVTHGLFSEPATQRLNELNLDEIIVSNSLDQTKNKKKIKKLKILSLAELLGNDIQ
ncbi:MAG: ribose-phosphate pyrophosphokinase [Candidatus Diapherotrites archaeon]|nr:ribose-phosphate pyrophosphokinase [Candidatus Diapherotrites archaeon]